jgi:hypothetical protein
MLVEMVQVDPAMVEVLPVQTLGLSTTVDAVEMLVARVPQVEVVAVEQQHLLLQQIELVLLPLLVVEVLVVEQTSTQTVLQEK